MGDDGDRLKKTGRETETDRQTDRDRERQRTNKLRQRPGDKQTEKQIIKTDRQSGRDCLLVS